MTHPLHDQVAALSAKGFSAGEVAAQLGVTRSVVMGVRFRGGLAAKRKKARPRAYDEPKEACRPATVPHVRGGGRQLEKLGARECHYPHGEPGKKGFHFCGAPALDGGPYCEKHHARCYIPLPRPGEQSVKTGPWPHAEAAE